MARCWLPFKRFMETVRFMRVWSLTPKQTKCLKIAKYLWQLRTTKLLWAFCEQINRFYLETLLDFAFQVSLACPHGNPDFYHLRVDMKTGKVWNIKYNNRNIRHMKEGIKAKSTDWITDRWRFKKVRPIMFLKVGSQCRALRLYSPPS